MTRTDTQSLADSYYRVQADLEGLRQLTSEPLLTKVGVSELKAQLADLHEHLVVHFDLLNQFGQLNEVAEWAPRLHDRLDRLQWQQFELTQELEQLQAELHRMQPAAVRLTVPRILKLIDRIEQHERKKNLLTTEALYQELAAMD